MGPCGLEPAPCEEAAADLRASIGESPLWELDFEAFRAGERQESAAGAGGVGGLRRRLRCVCLDRADRGRRGARTALPASESTWGRTAHMASRRRLDPRRRRRRRSAGPPARRELGQLRAFARRPGTMPHVCSQMALPSRCTTISRSGLRWCKRGRDRRSGGSQCPGRLTPVSAHQPTFSPLTSRCASVA
jgi:hypothetical protein